MSRLGTVALLATTLLTLSASFGQSIALTADPDAIEEDWVLVVGNPDPTGVGPQITTVMSPVSDASSAPFIAFDLNYREYPNFAAGGMQIQVWSSGQVLDTSGQGNALFNAAGETVTWTQRMAISAGTLNYNVSNGQSTTWGQFGQGSHLTVSVPTTLTSLAGYLPSVSAAKSGASWQENHVTTLTLKEVRYYAHNHLIWTDTNPKLLVDNASDSGD